MLQRFIAGHELVMKITDTGKNNKIFKQIF